MFICDVAGHGVRSALVTAMIRALAEELKPVATDPGQFLSKLNSDLHAILKHTGTPMLTTAFYLVADWRTGTMRYANAGHPKPLLSAAAPARSSRWPMPRAKASRRWACLKTRLPDLRGEARAQDLVMLFTDGLYEVQDSNDELYSQEMLLAGVQRRAQLPAPQLFDELLAEMRRFSGDSGFADDVCLVGIDYAGLAGAQSKGSVKLELVPPRGNKY